VLIKFSKLLLEDELEIMDTNFLEIELYETFVLYK
jgi:hypothetical protein